MGVVGWVLVLVASHWGPPHLGALPPDPSSPPPPRGPPIPHEPPPAPTLLLLGTHDAFLDTRLVPVLRRRLRPDARVHLLPGASHWLPEDQPRPIARLLHDFLGGGDQHP